MHTTKSIIDAIGRLRMAQALGVGYKAVSRAAEDGQFRAAWYPTVQRLASEHGIEVPDHLFAWRPPLPESDTPPTQEETGT